ncbi:MAG: hypothetical protein COV91_04055 [Candidatus Taylorbacteria bacterium CG11_big_fil_rev_8_21_14_0_20_46_11]|uniref:Right handed beta helix domain-containing protein n=1 Tax=Candidatus Taylorbacteria bacterium CG11_big_fil_rev_8_21_14_0_20_46_11 TaxID=1975025 RepID=A0A2H0KDI3_9BACT|nr:MAG: hypothetical protein COV91_04055 [Candidatus Taylorbacteria bacterium CG11_big_fil_rev_8_21_14_0_20_46_11]
MANNQPTTRIILKSALILISVVIVLIAINAHPAQAGYHSQGIATSTNLLLGNTADSIDSFYYNISSLPGDSSIRVQFSQDNETWYSSAGVQGDWDTLSSTGGATLSLSFLNWSGSSFYYKMELNATSDTLQTPVVDDIRLDYKPGGLEFNADGSLGLGERLGIGTFSPSSKLTVVGSGTGITPLVNFVNSASSTLFTVLENGQIGIGTTTPSAKLTVWGDGASGMTAFNVVDTASTTLFSVLDSGYVGIGTTTPWANLSVNQDDGQIAFAVGSSTATSFIIDQNGYVGIGTTTPTQKLSTDGLMYIGGTGTSTIENNLNILGTLQVGAGSTYITSANVNIGSGGSLGIGNVDVLNATTLGSSVVSSSLTSVGTLASLNVTGNTGIGTTSPMSTFAVAGTATLGTTTMQVWNKVVSVDGDHYSQDSTGIQEAINSLPDEGGKVFLPEGTYQIYSAITIPDNVWLEGAGASSTILYLANNANSNVIENADATNGNTNIKISDLKIDGNDANNTGTCVGIYLYGGVTYSVIENVYVYDAEDHGINVSAGEIYNGYNKISNNIIESAGDGGIFLGRSEINTIINNVSVSNWSGIRLYISDNNVVSNNAVKSNSYYGIEVDTHSDNNIISNNLIESNGRIGIYLVNGNNSYNSIIGNMIYNNGGSGSYSSIYIESSGDNNNIIADNHITDTAGTGYAINIGNSNASNNVLSNNYYSGTGATAINDAGTNTIYNSQLYGSDLVLKGSRYISVGTTTPSAKLTVWGDGVSGMTAFNVVDTASTTLFSVLDSGQVGIGTSTPYAKLSVVDENAGLTDDVFVISTSSEGAIFKVDGAGNIYYDGAASTPAADYAEYFYTKDTDLMSGETVCVDIARENAVKRCMRARDANVMGIVSTKPAIIGNNKTGFKDNPNYAIVGMLGQVPAKVSSENGDIRPGDSLTPASIPGVLMRAEAGDPTVGVALQRLTNEDELKTNGHEGVINVLISRRNKSLTVEQVEDKITDRIAAMEIEDEVNILISQAVDQLNLDDQINSQIDPKLLYLTSRLSVTEDSLTNQIITVNDQLSVIGYELMEMQDKISKLQIPNYKQITNHKFQIGEDGLIVFTDDETDGSALVEIIITPTTNQTAFVIDQQGQADIARFKANDIDIVKIAQDGQVSIIGELKVDGRILACAGSSCGEELENNIDQTMGDIGAEGKVVASSFESYCPDGFVWVPGSAKHGTLPGFCAMAGQMTSPQPSPSQGEGADPAQAGEAGEVWVNVSQGQAQLACQGLGENYHLISENEYLTMVENILRVAENYEAEEPDKLKLTGEYVLTNDNIVYDLAGDPPVGDSPVGGEWTDRIITRAELMLPVSDAWLEYYEVGDYKGFDIAPPYYLTDEDNNIGRILTGDNGSSRRGFVRGNSGLYSLDLSRSPAEASEDIGFRCAR